MPRSVLVTGGAGYIGSHVVLHLLDAGYEPVVYDDLSTGRREAVCGGTLVVADLADERCLESVFAEYQIAAVMHMAASTTIKESVAEPLQYYQNNVANTLRLLVCCRKSGVKHVVFSSSAAVYGIPPGGICEEACLPRPINPYGTTKLVGEMMLQDLAASSMLRYVALRYFSAAGADPAGRVGEHGPEATHLVKVACQAATGKRPGVTAFGNDYDTPDGTCVRDYVHVDDIARAHIEALDHLERGGDNLVLNCGSGDGHSVLQVLDKVMAVAGVEFPVTVGARRDGDPPWLVATNDRIRAELGWRPRRNLDEIIASALAWERKIG